MSGAARKVAISLRPILPFAPLISILIAALSFIFSSCLATCCSHAIAALLDLGQHPVPHDDQVRRSRCFCGSSTTDSNSGENRCMIGMDVGGSTFVPHSGPANAPDEGRSQSPNALPVSDAKGDAAGSRGPARDPHRRPRLGASRRERMVPPPLPQPVAGVLDEPPQSAQVRRAEPPPPSAGGARPRAQGTLALSGT